MRMLELRHKARALGLVPRDLKKADLIRAIQRQEGYTPCFGGSHGQCPYTDCCFRDDCLKIQS